jgi:hypothetical protein
MEAGMDELSEQAKAFLALAKREQEPTLENLQRVQRRVLGAAAATGATALSVKASASNKVVVGVARGALHGVAAKLGAGALALSLVGAGIWAAGRTSVDGSRSATATAPTLGEPVAATAAPGPSARDTLPDELGLLQRAEDALAGGDLPRALAVLAAHRQGFAAGHLAEERDALELLANCTLSPEATRERATRFVADHPKAMLNLRLRRACGLE